MNSIGKIVRALIKTLYYAGQPQKRIEFALRCRHVAEIIDLGQTRSFNEKFRYHLHLAVCQPCQNYLDTTRALKRAMLELMKLKTERLDIDELNRRLMEKYATKPNRS